MSNLDIGFYFTILMRRLHLVLAIAVAVLLAAAIAIRFLPPVYGASAKILAEAPQIPAELARSTVPMAATSQILIIQQQITTREALIALAKRLDIYRDKKVKPTDEDVVRDLTKRIRFDQVPLDGTDSDPGVAVFAVSFTANKPDMAANVANEIADMILARNQRERTDLASSTLQFFNQKVAGLDADLKRLEAEILKFKNEHKDALPESLEFRRNLQGSLQERQASLEREESDLRARRNTLIVTYTGAGQLTGAIPLTPEQQMLADLNKALAEQLATFTEDSPNIISIRARIAALQKSLLAPHPGTTTKKDPASSDKKASFGLDLQLSDIDDRLAAITEEKRAIGQRLEDLTRSIAATPTNETVLNAFMRNHENIQTQYNAAIARRAEALTGEQIELRANGERFSLLEPATPPAKPDSPKRRLIVAMGGIGGIGLGLALVVLLELLNKTVRRPKDLSRLLQAQPLGTVPVVRTRREIRAARLRLGFAAFLSAGAMPASLALVHYYYMPLDLVFQKLVSGFAWIGTT